MKKEGQTCLYAQTYVDKDHPRIMLRGCMDDLDAQFIRVSALLRERGHEGLAQQVDSIGVGCAAVMRAEVLEQPVAPLRFLDMSPEEVHEMSHAVARHFGFGHLRLCADMGLEMAELNCLRTKVRACEIAAVRAFGTNSPRDDIIRTLNRMSSAVYVLMCMWQKERAAR
nr:hypothetical protein [Maliibacterium massiliense]